MQNTQLLIIDPQFDFCDPSGALSVPGAKEDMERLGTFISRVQDKLASIHVTLDSHNFIDIAHPVFWVDQNGKNPDPFTIITAADVENGVFRTAMPSWQTKAADYVKTLEQNARYPLCIWPPHCLIGSVGTSVMPEIMNPLNDWSASKKCTINFVAKGSNPWTEHYSGIQADVPDPNDPSTQINTGLVKTLEDADIILIAGEASSHCLANTARDIANNFSDDSYIQKLVFLKDAASAVPGFEQFETDFIDEMSAKGMKVTTTSEWMN